MNELILSFENQNSDIKFQNSSTEVNKRFSDKITFSENVENCCIGVIDAINSTRITAMLSEQKTHYYYKIFLNWMSIIIQDHGGIIVKNIGDDLLYFFSDTDRNGRTQSIRNAVECSFAMVTSHSSVNSLMKKLGLPSVDFRIGLDYGNLTIIRHSDPKMGDDIFGTTVNMRSKLNTSSFANQVIIGNDLYKKIRMFKEYELRPIIERYFVQKLEYPTYSLSRNDGS